MFVLMYVDGLVTVVFMHYHHHAFGSLLLHLYHSVLWWLKHKLLIHYWQHTCSH